MNPFEKYACYTQSHLYYQYQQDQKERIKRQSLNSTHSVVLLRPKRACRISSLISSSVISELPFSSLC